MSGRRAVWITSGNCSFLPMSTLISQEPAACSKFDFANDLITESLAPSLMKVIVSLPVPPSLFLHLSRSSVLARDKSTLSWRHLYRPLVKDVLHPDNMCARWDGEGRISYTERSRKEINVNVIDGYIMLTGYILCIYSLQYVAYLNISKFV